MSCCFPTLPYQSHPRRRAYTGGRGWSGSSSSTYRPGMHVTTPSNLAMSGLWPEEFHHGYTPTTAGHHTRSGRAQSSCPLRQRPANEVLDCGFACAVSWSCVFRVSVVVSGQRRGGGCDRLGGLMVFWGSDRCGGWARGSLADHDGRYHDDVHCGEVRQTRAGRG
ncbi:uncharacterized protein CC84DRAFT_185570 [Paraphaeosphaeria sporulosa]|uniref:Uncharacterized protein n=1 Tax=Paraphaeosphaeria sporulosa TaxID=1460663 RepID=A0A177C1H9_9PLEO|nr:uncharacterized protein CC84DRAFT_185570 [Paraphaeosphaeria sporulosa]OAG01286.1 hypothetical protein CC84DRAFT_185570 [Paraphaeosphaeria sporulosa]